MKHLHLALSLCAAAALPAACAPATTTYPSLLPRAVEKRSAAEPVAPVVAAAPDPALDARIATLAAALDTGRKDFAVAAARADGAARRAKGDAVGGERWLDAQTALAELDVYRAGSSGLVTDIEELALARAADGKPPYSALDTALQEAQAELDAQTGRIATLQASLPAA